MHTITRLAKDRTPAVVFTDYDDRMRLLKEMRAANVMRPIRFMSEKDLFNKVFFAYQPHALHEASKTLKTTPEVAEMCLDFLYYVDENAQYDSNRLKTLQSLKQTLRERKALKIEYTLDSWFNNQDIILMKPVYDAFYKDAFSHLKARYPITKAYEEPRKRTFKHTVLKTLEDEIADIAVRMADYRETGIPYERMALLNAHSAYMPYIRTVFSMFGIPYNSDQPSTLYMFKLTQKFLEDLNNHASKPLYEAFSAVLDTLKKETRNEKEAALLNEITKAVNPLVRLEGSVETLKPLIIHALKNSYHKAPQYANGVDVKQITDGGFSAYKHVFVVGMHEGFAPSYEEEDDYLGESEKTAIGYPTAKALNRNKKSAILDALPRYQNVHIFESTESMRETYQRASILEALSEAHRFEEEAPRAIKDQPYSEQLDRIQAKMAYDDYLFHDTVSETLKGLYPVFQEAFTPHDPKWTGLDKETLNALLTDTFRVSTTQIDRYAECAFRFLLEDILNVDPVDDPFNMDLGTFFHDVLEHSLHKESIQATDLDDALKRTLKRSDKAYTDREIAFFKNAYPFIIRAHRIIRSQHESSSYQHEQSEATVEMHFDLGRHITFKGKIDKVMRKGDAFYLIDYKTGKKTLDLTLAPHGMKAQLLFYVLLYKANAETLKPVGFFEQTVYPKMPKRVLGKTKEAQYEEALKLKGYVIDDLDELESIDKYYETDSMIHGLSITKKGVFSKTVKRFDEEGLDRLLSTLHTKLETMLEAISVGHFPINPKQNEKRKPISCAYCSFSDICYKRPEDFETLKVENGFKEVFTALKEED